MAVRSPHLLFLNPSAALGGAERVLLDLIASLRSAAPELRLTLIAGADGPLIGEAHALGAEAAALPMPRRLARLGDAGAHGPAGKQVGRLRLAVRLTLAAPSGLAYLSRLRRHVRALAPDLVQSNGFKMHLLAAWAAPRRRPLVWHLHDFVSYRPLMSRLLARASRRPEAVITNSRAVADDYATVHRGAAPLLPVYNGVDLERFTPRGPALDLDRLSGLPPPAPGTLRIGLLSTLSRWKGQKVFLRAVASIARERAIRGYLIGGALYATDGSQYGPRELQSEAERLGLDDRVGFTGFVERAERAIRALDVIVHASTEPEPFGLVIAEAMACGKPLVASRGGGVTELVEEGVDGLLHPPADADALAVALARLIDDDALRARLGAAGRRTAERRFDRRRMADELLPLYRRLLEAGP